MARRLLRSKRTHPSGTHMFSPLVGLVRSGMKRKRNAPSTRVSGSLARASTTVRRTAKHKTRAGARFKIGAYSGDLIASKPVSIAKPGSRIRRRQFGHQSVANRNWVGGTNIQSEYFLFSLIAEGIVANVLKRLGDTRSDKETNVPSSFLTRLQLNFVRDDSTTGGSGDVLHAVDIDMVNDTSFNGIVYNEQVVSFNPVTVDGVTQPDNTGLNKIIFEQAVQGYYPQGIFAFRGVPGSPATLGPEIMRDTQLGKMNIKVDIAKTHKFQNVTPATGDRGSGTSNYNVNAIDANPLEGKLMTFRNLAPTWNKGWLVRQSVVNDLENFSGRPRSLVEWDYEQIGIDAHPLPDINEFEAMPLRPSTVYANAKAAGTVRFPPGGFKVFKTKFTYDGSVRRLCRDVTQVTTFIGGVEAPFSANKYPPLGSSFLMCLLPTIKTVADEAVAVAFDFVTDGKVHCTKFKGGTLPTTNFIE